MCFLQLSKPKARSGARVDLESVMGPNAPQKVHFNWYHDQDSQRNTNNNNNNGGMDKDKGK